MRQIRMVLVLIILCLVMFTACNFARGVWNGITGQETDSTKAAQQINGAADSAISDAKATGKIDTEKILALVQMMQDYQTKAESEKPDYLELFGAMVGIGIGTYLGTRKVRTSKIGAMINSIISLGGKSEPKKV